VWPVPLAQVIFTSKAWFLGIYLTFHGQKSLKIQSLPHSEPQILPNKFHYPAHQDLSNNTKGTFPIPLKFSATI
jgi:hypothetical protein